MEERINIFQKYCSLIIRKHIIDHHNIDRLLKIFDKLYIVLLNKQELHNESSKESSLNFNYNVNDYDKKVDKLEELKDKNYEKLRNKLAEELYYYQNNILKENQQLENKDFRIICENPSLFLVIMALLRKSHSVYITIQPLIITNKRYYSILNFHEPQIKFLRIECRYSNPYPVNTFVQDGWIFDESKDDFDLSYGVSLSAFSIFKFLANSNFIYSLQELMIN